MSDIGVYCIRNTVTGERYVGGTAGMKNRRANHFTRLRCGKHSNASLQTSWNQHGESSFAFEVLEACDSNRVGDLEREWVERLNPEFNRGDGRPAGTGAGYTAVVRVLFTPPAAKALQAWREKHGAMSLSDAGRRIIEQVLRREGLL